MVEGQVAARGDSVTQAWMSAVEKVGAVKLPLELCGEEGLSRKSFSMDTGAHAEQRGEGRNHPTHPHTGTGWGIVTGNRSFACWVSRGRGVVFFYLLEVMQEEVPNSAERKVECLWKHNFSVWTVPLERQKKHEVIYSCSPQHFNIYIKSRAFVLHLMSRSE